MSVGAEGFWLERGPASFLGDVTAEAASAGVAVATVPDRVPLGMADALADRLRDGGFDAVFRVAAGNDRSVVHRMALAAGMAGGALRTVGSILGSHEVGAGAFMVDVSDPAEAGQWATLAGTFASERRRMSAPLLPALVVMARVDGLRDAPRFPSPGRDLRWFGRVSTTDMRRFVERTRDHDGGLANRLATETATELAAWDPALATALAALPDAALLDPLAALATCAGACADGFRGEREPTWGNGSRDVVDGIPVTHALHLLAEGDRKSVERRAWRAQARVLLPFIEEVLAHLRIKYAGLLAEALPTTLETRNGLETLDHPCDLELPSMRLLLAGEMTPAEESFTKVLSIARNAVAHHRTVSPRYLSLLAGAWGPMLAEGRAAAHWAAPRRGQRVVITFGDDDKRHATDRRSARHLAEAVTARLAEGKDAVVPGDGLGRGGRLGVTMAVPDCFEVVYRVVTRDADDIDEILAADGRDDVTVEDMPARDRRLGGSAAHRESIRVDAGRGTLAPAPDGPQ